MEAHLGIQVCGRAVWKLRQAFEGRNRRLHLLCGQGSDGRQRSAVNCSCTVQTAPQHLLHALRVGRIDAVGILRVGQSDFGAALRFSPAICVGLGREAAGRKTTMDASQCFFVSSHLRLVGAGQGDKTIGTLLQMLFECSFVQRGHSLASAALLKQRTDHKG
jgi:hypothetical protein